jgi:uncharacterized RDD family membrane protein YckC
MHGDDAPTGTNGPAPPPVPLGPEEEAERVQRQLAAWRMRTARTSVEVRYAGFIVRALALLIDAVILVGSGMALVIAGVFGVRTGLDVLAIPAPIGIEETLAQLTSWAWFAMAFLYFTVLHRSGGQTIGKAVVGVRVCTLDFDPLGTLRSAFRTFCYLASSSFGGVGFLLAIVTPRKRAWHDVIAGTCVVHLQES